MADASLVVTSELTRLELERAVIRCRVTGTLTATQERWVSNWLKVFFAECTVLPLDRGVLVRAAQPFPVEPVRSLDAIHLATISQLQLKLRWFTVVSRDERMRENAEALGLRVVP